MEKPLDEVRPHYNPLVSITLQFQDGVTLVAEAIEGFLAAHDNWTNDWSSNDMAIAIMDAIRTQVKHERS